METIEYMYKGKVIEFFFGDDIMVNATEMASVFGKSVYDFKRLESTKKWVKWLENSAIRAKRSEGSPVRFAGNAVLPGEIMHRSADLMPILIVQKGGDSGGTTWMHRLLAIEFAMWLDIDFKGWVILKIDHMLYEYSVGKRTIALRRKKLNEELDSLFRDNPEDKKLQRVREIHAEHNQLKGDQLNLQRNFNKDIIQGNR